ncbi:DUF4271 domain-containing protein [Hugenholtzia roseola]|uniref:DUF4271 domain-containing protein n=1 Tax=Hugenholtzia roseola TaxID=1002 RepID=UPI000417EB17|nr:DUF4271 domain-containing protein [Hugenholtzia roseola]
MRLEEYTIFTKWQPLPLPPLPYGSKRKSVLPFRWGFFGLLMALLLLCQIPESVAQNQTKDNQKALQKEWAQLSNRIYQDQTDRWKIYQEAEASYLPYLPAQMPAQAVLHLILERQTWQQPLVESLALFSPTETRLFIDNVFIGSFEGIYFLDKKTVEGYFKKHNRPQVLISLYAPQKPFKAAIPAFILHAPVQRKTQDSTILSPENTKEIATALDTTPTKQPDSLLLDSAKQKKATKSPSFYEEATPEPRKKVAVYSWVVVFSLGLLALVILISNYLVPLFDLAAFGEAIAFFIRPNYIYKRTDRLLVVSFILYYALVLSFAILILGLYADSLGFEIALSGRLLFLELLFEWFSLALTAAILIGLHLLLVQFLSNIFFNQKQQTDLHVQGIINSMVLILGVALPLVVMVSMLGIFWEGAIWEISFKIGLFLYFIRTLLLSFHLYKNIATQRFYLFSYLCIAEYAPLLLMAQVLMAAV